MKIKIDDRLYLVSDQWQFILRKYFKEAEDGSRKFKVVGYYSSLENVLDGIVKLKTLQSDATSLVELLAEQKQIKKEIRELLEV